MTCRFGCSVEQSELKGGLLQRRDVQNVHLRGGHACMWTGYLVTVGSYGIHRAVRDCSLVVSYSRSGCANQQSLNKQPHNISLLGGEEIRRILKVVDQMSVWNYLPSRHRWAPNQCKKTITAFGRLQHQKKIRRGSSLR